MALGNSNAHSANSLSQKLHHDVNASYSPQCQTDADHGGKASYLSYLKDHGSQNGNTQLKCLTFVSFQSICTADHVVKAAEVRL